MAQVQAYDLYLEFWSGDTLKLTLPLQHKCTSPVHLFFYVPRDRKGECFRNMTGEVKKAVCRYFRGKSIL